MKKQFTAITQEAVNAGAKYASEEHAGVIINNPVKYAAFREGWKAKAEQDADMYEALKALVEADEFKHNITDIAGWERQEEMAKYMDMKLSAWDKVKAAISKANPE